MTKLETINKYYNELISKPLNILTDDELNNILKYLELINNNILTEQKMRKFIIDLVI